MAQEMTKNDLVQLGRDYLAGMPIGDIAEKYKLHRSTVTLLRKRLGLPDMRRPRGVKAIATEEEVKAAKKALGKRK